MSISHEINNFQDVIDSRDVIDRIEQLQSYGVAPYDPATAPENDGGDEDERELAALLALQEEAEGYSEDWQHGATLIRDSYFKEYAQELADDIGAINADASWPNDCIDWDKAARELQMDYTAVDFDGVTYWIR